MTEQQKKVIIKSFILLLIFFTISGVVLWILGEFNKNRILSILGFVGTIISPNMLLGMAIKIYINRKHLNNVREALEEVGLYEKETTTKKTVKIEGKNQKLLKLHNWTILIKDENKIVMNYHRKNATTKDKYIDFQNALIELLEEQRKSTPPDAL